MTFPIEQAVDFSDVVGKLQCEQVWEFETGIRPACPQVAEDTFEALAAPLDFPSLQNAIVPGDHVAIAADPNVPSIDLVVEGAVRAIDQAGAGQIDVVVSDETTDATFDSIVRRATDRCRVTRHLCSQRASVCYLAADAGADPIYLNRLLVDADLVLPIAACRVADATRDSDVTGLYPTFSDSLARRRCLGQRSRPMSNRRSGLAPSEEPAWLLGVQLMLGVTATPCGRAREIVAGTPHAIRNRLVAANAQSDEFSSSASLVIASLDGDAQQQSWINAARAASAAARFASPNATIVLWTAISDQLSLPSADLLQDLSSQDPDAEDEVDEETGAFPSWDADAGPRRILANIAQSHRLLIRSQLEQDAIEAMGLGAIDSIQQLIKLSQSLDSCGILRAAQFAGPTV